MSDHEHGPFCDDAGCSVPTTATVHCPRCRVTMNLGHQIISLEDDDEPAAEYVSNASIEFQPAGELAVTQCHFCHGEVEVLWLAPELAAALREEREDDDQDRQ